MSDLPPGWEWATVGELMGAGLFSDGDWVETKDQDPHGEVRLLQLADIGEGHFRDRSNRYLTAKSASALGCTYLEPGDVLVARMPDPLGRACRVPRLDRPAITAVDVCILRPTVTGVDPGWLLWAINSPQARLQVTALQSGTTRKRISRRNLATIRLAVPPRSEQERIVAAIDEHLTRLDAGVGTLSRIPAQLEHLKWAPAEAAWRRGDAPRRALGDVGLVVTGTTPGAKNPTYWDGDHCFATPRDLQHGGRVLTTERQLSNTGFGVARWLPAGAVLVTCIGATLGKAAVTTTATAFNFNQQLNGLFPDHGTATPGYLLAILSCPSGQRQLWAESSSTTLPILNKGRFARLTVPIPPSMNSEGSRPSLLH